jgi:tetratricopeptide (TPR) repeat protein
MMHELAASHYLWSREARQHDRRQALRIAATLSSGAAHAEEGNLPEALNKKQTAAAMARQYGRPIQMVMTLNALASMYTTLKEYDKGFEALKEAWPYAERTNSPGRMASLKNLEYGLAIETNQPRRALRALLAALELERKIGADRMIAISLVDLSDSYLKEHDYRKALS